MVSMRSSMSLVFASALAGCATPVPHVQPPAPPPAETTLAVTRPKPPRVGCREQPGVSTWERRLRSNHRLLADTEQSARQGERYIPRLRRILEESGIPPALALLPIIESKFQLRARGRYGELGLWQLRHATARRFGLVVNGRRDDRLDPELATRGAARFLLYLHERYDDWLLAIAAYNAGEQRIDRAMAHHPGATFWDLARDGRLPRHCREYVPHFLAVVQMVEKAPFCPDARERTALNGSEA